jgi:hypothetical protein
MILIREVTAKELGRLFLNELKKAANNEIPSLYTYERAAEAVLNSLQVKADVRPMTLPDADPSSLQLCTANLDVSH